MIELPLAEASGQLDRLRDALTHNNAEQTATLTEDGKPVLAVMPWALYETLLDMARIPTDPVTLLAAPAEIRKRILSLAAARAEAVYRTDAALTDFEAFGEDDLYDGTE